MANVNELMQDLEDFILEEVNDLQGELHKNFKRDNPRDTGYSSSRWKNARKVGRIGQTATISNDAPYIGYLEMGWSSQAPSGFVERNIVQSLNRRK